MDYSLLKKIIVVAFLVFFAYSPPLKAEDWRSFHTKYLILRYQADEDLIKFNRQIKFDTPSKGVFSFKKKSKGSGNVLFDGIQKKMDSLFEKVQLILDMRKPFPKVWVNIYPNEDALHQAYFKIYKKKKKLRAWYIYEYNIIYVNVKDLFAGMLAHEIAHAVVDHYLSVRPPRASAEILARYVDKHLYEAPKVY